MDRRPFLRWVNDRQRIHGQIETLASIDRCLIKNRCSASDAFDTIVSRLAIRVRCRAHGRLERTGKVRLVVEAAVHGNIRNAVRRAHELPACVFNALAMAPAVRAFAKRDLERATEIAPGQPARRGELRDGKPEVEPCKRDLFHGSHLPFGKSSGWPRATPCYRLLMDPQGLGDVAGAGGAIRTFHIRHLVKCLMQ